jgi:rhodanese-related sulfurtransferase
VASSVASSPTIEDISRITPAEAKELLDSGMAVLYDARPEGEYRALHAAGALSFPASDMAAHYGELPTDKSLIFY